MDDEVITLIFGVIILVLTINTIAIWSIASTMYGQNPAQQMIAASGSPDSNLLASPKSVPAAPTAATSPTPTVTPEKPPSEASTIVSTPVPTPISYVKIETPEPPVTEKRISIQPEFPRLSEEDEEDFVTIYSLSNQNVSQSLPHVSFNLVNPPLIIDYDFTPFNITIQKYIEYKVISTQFKGNVTISRPFELSSFKLTVRDKNTREIVAEDGIGKIYSYDSPKQMLLDKSGNFEFEFTGEYGKITLTMKVKKEGNIP